MSVLCNCASDPHGVAAEDLERASSIHPRMLGQAVAAGRVSQVAQQYGVFTALVNRGAGDGLTEPAQQPQALFRGAVTLQFNAALGTHALVFGRAASIGCELSRGRTLGPAINKLFQIKLRDVVLCAVHGSKATSGLL